MNGNEAAARAAIHAGCRFFAGYPIDPASELLETMVVEMPTAGGVCIQAESEIIASNMLIGAAAAGVRTMTCSSGPGMDLLQEAMGQIANAGLPVVIVNMSRSGPGNESIGTGQDDYFQCVKGGAHGDYYYYVLAPWSVGEMATETVRAFELADRYRMPAIVYGDTTMANLHEPVDIEAIPVPDPVDKSWAVPGLTEDGQPTRIVAAYESGSSYEGLWDFKEKTKTQMWDRALTAQNEARWEVYGSDEAEILLVAFGSAARVCLTALEGARTRGFSVKLFRPLTLWPFPEAALRDAAQSAERVIVVELNQGQMVQDVARIVQRDVEFYCRNGGNLPFPSEIVEVIDEGPAAAQYLPVPGAFVHRGARQPST